MWGILKTVGSFFSQAVEGAGSLVKIFGEPFKFLFGSILGGTDDEIEKKMKEINYDEIRRKFLENVVVLFTDCCETTRRMYWGIFYLSLIFIFILAAELYVVFSDSQKTPRKSHLSRPKTEPTLIMMKPVRERSKPRAQPTIVMMKPKREPSKSKTKRTITTMKPARELSKSKKNNTFPQ